MRKPTDRPKAEKGANLPKGWQLLPKGWQLLPKGWQLLIFEKTQYRIILSKVYAGFCHLRKLAKVLKYYKYTLE